MTELQMGLIGLGTTAVVGVFAYNKWQEHRHRKAVEAVLKPQHEDVLLGETTRPKAAERSEPAMSDLAAPTDGERLEPMFSEAPADALEDAPTDTPRLARRLEEMPPEPAAFDSTEVSEALPDEMHDVPLPAALLDPRLEFIVAMELVEPVAAMQILHSQRDVLSRLSKPVHWVAYNERTREWERLAGDSTLMVRRLRVGLQLVNRLGPLSEGDLAVFTNAMQMLADELMAVADMPASQMLAQAVELDRFCAAVDLEIGVNLVSRGSAFSGTKIRALAEAAGLVLGIDGVFTRYDEAGIAQFSLQNYESTQFTADSIRTMTTHGLTFVLDVPRVDHGERVFGQMTELARRFAETLQGALVDDNRQPLSESQLEHIRREFIGKPQASMASFGLPAGSPQALRLFS